MKNIFLQKCIIGKLPDGFCIRKLLITRMMIYDVDDDKDDDDDDSDDKDDDGDDNMFLHLLP